MVWTTPKTFTAGERLFAQDLNTYVSDNLTDLDTRVQAIPAAPTALQFDTVATITATDASWSVPTLADPVVKVTVVGGGGGGLGWNNSNGAQVSGADGNASSFACAAGTVTGGGGNKGLGAFGGSDANGPAATDGLVSYNAGRNAISVTTNIRTGADAVGGSITVGYLDLTGISTANVTIGAGGAGGNNYLDGSAGGDGVVIVEYRAG